MNPIIIYTSIDSKKNAKTLAKIIINNHLAACVNIIPIEKSIYYWEGKLESESEFQLMIKTDIKYKTSIEEIIKIRDLRRAKSKIIFPREKTLRDSAADALITKMENDGQHDEVRV